MNPIQRTRTRIVQAWFGLGAGAAQLNLPQSSDQRVLSVLAHQALNRKRTWQVAPTYTELPRMCCSTLIKGINHWIAMVLLGYAGENLVRAGFQKAGKALMRDPSTGRTLIRLSIASSIDAFAVGPGIVAVPFSIISLLAGRRLGETFGKRMAILEGLILIGSSLRVVLTHLFP